MAQWDWPPDSWKFQAATATVATDASFAASHVFDFGHAVVAYVSATLLATTSDSEVFALDHLYAKVTTTDSRVPDMFDSGIALTMTPHLADVGNVASVSVVSSRCLLVRVELDDADNGDTVYEGANLPAVQVRFDVEYR